MEEIVFFVQGSSPEPYEVRFAKKGENLNAYCTCMAGEKGQYCKHRFAILAGDTNAIVSDNKHQVQVAKSWLSGTDVELALLDMVKAESEHEAAKKRFSEAKKNVARAMLR